MISPGILAFLRNVAPPPSATMQGEPFTRDPCLVQPFLEPECQSRVGKHHIFAFSMIAKQGLMGTSQKHILLTAMPSKPDKMVVFLSLTNGRVRTFSLNWSVLLHLISTKMAFCAEA